MKRIIFLILLPFLPYLASAQVAKDTVTVLTIAQIPQGAIRDTTNLTFVQDNGFKKATFDSLYKYTRVKLLAAGAITSAELANALSNETGTGAAVFATSPVLTTPNLGTPSAATLTNATGLPIATGLTGLGAANHIPYATSATAMTTGAGLTFDGTNFATTGTATATKFIPTGNAVAGNGLYLPATNTLAFSTDGAERMRIKSDGHIGFGTDDPKRPVHFRLGFLMVEATPGAAAYIQLSYNGATNAQSGYLGYGDNKVMTFWTQNTQRMALDGNGNFGIGETAPAVQFHTTGGVRFATFAGGGTTTLSVDNAGNLLRTSTVEYKKDIEPIRYGLKEVMDLQPVNFNWIDEDRFGNVNENGFVAEDVMNVLPNVANADGNGVFMDYTKLIAVLTKAIQEQQAQIEQLKQRITQLENK